MATDRHGPGAPAKSTACVLRESRFDIRNRVVGRRFSGVRDAYRARSGGKRAVEAR